MTRSGDKNITRKFSHPQAFLIPAPRPQQKLHRCTDLCSKVGTIPHEGQVQNNASHAAKIKNACKPPDQQRTNEHVIHKKITFMRIYVTICCWLLHEAAGCYGKLLVATGSCWLLQEATGCERKLLVATQSYWFQH